MKMMILGAAAARLHWCRMMSTTTKTMSNPNPWLMLRPTFDRSRGGMVYNFYSLEDNEVVRINKYGPGPDPPEHPDDDAEVVGSSHGWLALKNHRNNELFLSNPITRRHIKLPPIDSLPNPEFNLSRCSASANVSKLILSSSPDDADCRAMVAFGWSGRLAFCRPGHSRHWAPIGQLFMEREDYKYNYKYARSYDDLVFSSKSNVFTCLTSSKFHNRGLEDWDLTSVDSPKIDWIRRQGDEKEENNKEMKQHLVYAEQTAELFIVNRLIEEGRTRSFDVFTVEKEEGGWTNIRPCWRPDMALFVGNNHSFAVSAPHFKPNSIYFTDGDGDSVGRPDVGIYDCDDETFSNCYYPYDGDQALDDTDDTPIWFTPMLT